MTFFIVMTLYLVYLAVPTLYLGMDIVKESSSSFNYLLLLFSTLPLILGMYTLISKVDI